MANMPGSINYPMTMSAGFQTGYVGRDTTFGSGSMMNPTVCAGFGYGGQAFAGNTFDYGAVPNIAPSAGGINSLMGGHGILGGPPPTIGGATPISGGHVTSNTNSKDPKALRSRVFVGNLNTTIVTREQLHSIFAPFGEIVAVSIHKGYAFVQYSHESEARNAVTFTDGSPLCGKKLDVTISSEPKSQTDDPTVSKRSSDIGRSGPDTKKSRFVESESTSTTRKSFNNTINSYVSANKEVKISSATSYGSGVGAVLSSEKLAKGDDILLCGTCRQLFITIDTFSDHKRNCKAPGILVKHENGEQQDQKPNIDVVNDRKAVGEPSCLRCFICHESFDFSWNLLVHMQDIHSMKVFEVAAVEAEDVDMKPKVEPSCK